MKATIESALAVVGVGVLCIAAMFISAKKVLDEIGHNERPSK